MRLEHRTFDRPDDVLEFELMRIDELQLGVGVIDRKVFAPGWRWSTHYRPYADTDLCEEAHVLYHLAGRFGVADRDGAELEAVPGDISVLPPGHDAWVIGDEPVVVIDVFGLIAEDQSEGLASEG